MPKLQRTRGCDTRRAVSYKEEARVHSARAAREQVCNTEGMLRVRWTSQLAPFAALCAVLVVNAAVGLQVHTHNNSPRRRQRSCANTYCGSHESSWNVCGCMCTVGPGGMCNSCCGCSCVHSCPSGTTSSGRKALSTCTVKAGSYGKAGMQQAPSSVQAQCPCMLELV